MTEEQRVTRAFEDATAALKGATETIRDLRQKLDLAIECLEDYSEHILFDIYEWAKQPAIKTLEKIR